MPGQPSRLPGSPANLQVALDAILLIERDDNHAILGATVRKIKILSRSAPFCREPPRTRVPRHLPIPENSLDGELEFPRRIKPLKSNSGRRQSYLRVSIWMAHCWTARWTPKSCGHAGLHQMLSARSSYRCDPLPNCSIGAVSLGPAFSLHQTVK